MATPLLSLLCLVLVAGAFFSWKKVQQSARTLGAITSERDTATQQLGSLQERFRAVVDADAEALRIVSVATTERTQLLAAANAERARIVQDLADTRDRLTRSIASLADQQEAQQQAQHSLQQRIVALQAEFDALDKQANLQSFGFYQPRFDFVTSAEYQQKIEYTRTAQKNLITAGTAATCSTEWTVNGSVAEGRKNTAQYLKLILRAFNGECDAAIAKVKYNNVLVMETRIKKSYEAINKISVTQHSSLSATYLDLRLRELYLVHEVQEKKEIQRQVREEEQAQRELERARLDAEKEEKRYADALRKAQQDVQKANRRSAAEIAGTNRCPATTTDPSPAA